MNKLYVNAVLVSYCCVTNLPPLPPQKKHGDLKQREAFTVSVSEDQEFRSGLAGWL